MDEPAYIFKTAEDVIEIQLSGDWCIHQPTPELNSQELDFTRTPSTSLSSLCLIDQSIGQWDSMLMLFVMQCHRWCQRHNITIDVQQMPPAVGKLLAVATAVTPYESNATADPDDDWGWVGGRRIQQVFDSFKEFLIFTGSLGKTLTKFARGHTNTRSIDIWYFVEQVGPKAVGIITLISVLVGMILAYMGLVQLRQMGAQIYVADLVSIGMTREMGALMTGVVLAGRTGAAYAAQLGTMKVNEEIDAIQTMSMSVMEFLVLPRMLALVIIMPLLCVYSDILGMIGGAIIATGMDISWSQYILETQGSIDLVDFACGIVKSFFFAILIGIAGCQAGLQCGRDSDAVGFATTTAVVRAIVYIIVADAAFNILYDKLGI